MSKGAENFQNWALNDTGIRPFVEIGPHLCDNRNARADDDGVLDYLEATREDLLRREPGEDWSIEAVDHVEALFDV